MDRQIDGKGPLGTSQPLLEEQSFSLVEKGGEARVEGGLRLEEEKKIRHLQEDKNVSLPPPPFLFSCGCLPWEEGPTKGKLLFWRGLSTRRAYTVSVYARRVPTPLFGESSSATQPISLVMVKFFFCYLGAGFDCSKESRGRGGLTITKFTLVILVGYPLLHSLFLSSSFSIGQKKKSMRGG